MQVGAAIVASRFVVAEVPPLTLAMLRYAIGFLCLLPFALPLLAAVRAQLRPRDLAAMAALGIGQFGILIALLNWGLQTVPAAPAALVFASFPLLTLLVARLAGHEHLSTPKLLGVGLTLAGVAVALGAGVLQLGQARGEWAVLASALTGAVCSVLYRPYLRRHAALPLSVWAMSAAVLFLLGWGLLEGGLAQARALTAPGLVALLFIGLSSGIGYFLWLWALRHAPASRVTLFLAFSPLTSLWLGSAWLHEPVPARLWLALALVAGGLVAAGRR